MEQFQTLIFQEGILDLTRLLTAVFNLHPEIPLLQPVSHSSHKYRQFQSISRCVSEGRKNVIIWGDVNTVGDMPMQLKYASAFCQLKHNCTNQFFGLFFDKKSVIHELLRVWLKDLQLSGMGWVFLSTKDVPT